MAGLVDLIRAYLGLAPSSGISAQSAQGLARDPDLDKSLYQQPIQPTYQPLGNDPTRRVTAEEYARLLQQQKAAQDAAYQAWILRGKR